MSKTFFEGEWGFLHGEISTYHLDILPRCTITATRYMLEINIGFLNFRLWLTLFSDQMQEINRKHKD